MNTLGKIVRILLIAGLVVAIFFIGRWTSPAAKIVTVEVPVEKIVEKTVTVEVPVEKIVEKTVTVEVPAVCPVTEQPKEVRIPDTIKQFKDLATFYIDGDQFIENWKVQGAQMSYTCQYGYGVFITMDPGVVNGQSTSDLGAVFYVACDKGEVITLTTPHWSTSALHQQIHLVEFTQELSEKQATEFLKVLKIDEGKEVSYYIDSEGKITKN